MGGDGGLNILPQKRWNVYNFENREKVRRDEEAAAREEQTKREEAQKRASESRLEQLRRPKSAHGLALPTTTTAVAPIEETVVEAEVKSELDSKHINLFDGIKIFDPVVVVRKENGEDEGSKKKKMKKEALPPRVVGPEDEKYRLGYGVIGKGVKAPWYTMRPSMADDGDEEEERDNGGKYGKGTREGRSCGEKKKKTLEELREERMKREKKEKERERELLRQKGRSGGGSSWSSRGSYRRDR